MKAVEELIGIIRTAYDRVTAYCSGRCLAKQCNECPLNGLSELLGEALAKMEVVKAVAEDYGSKISLYEEEAERLRGELEKVREELGELKERVSKLEPRRFKIDWDRVKQLSWKWGRKRGVKVISREELEQEYPELLRELEDRGELQFKFTTIKYYPESGKIVMFKK